MQVLAILKAVLAALKLGKKYWPVVAVVLAMIAKVASGDTSGLSESFAAIVAAIAAVNGANRADKAEKALRAVSDATKEVVEQVSVGGYSLVKSNGAPLNDDVQVVLLMADRPLLNEPVDVPELAHLSFYPTDLRGPDLTDVASKSAPPFRFADVAPYFGVQTPEDK